MVLVGSVGIGSKGWCLMLQLRHLLDLEELQSCQHDGFLLLLLAHKLDGRCATLRLRHPRTLLLGCSC